MKTPSCLGRSAIGEPSANVANGNHLAPYRTHCRASRALSSWQLQSLSQPSPKNMSAACGIFRPYPNGHTGMARTLYLPTLCHALSSACDDGPYGMASILHYRLERSASMRCRAIIVFTCGRFPVEVFRAGRSFDETRRRHLLVADQEGSLTASVGSIGAVAGNQAGMAADATIGPPLEGSPAGRWA